MRRFCKTALMIAASVILTSTIISADGTVTSSLTGEEVSEEIEARRPVGFMIDNVKDAVPQSGISQAVIYFESEVESNLSRICAVFENYDGIDKIGPLRSCRDYFISLVSGLDAIYEHYGQAAYALPYLESDDVDNISAMMNYASDFYRDGPHDAPHNAYVSGSGMDNMIAKVGYSTVHDADYTPQYQFAAAGEVVSNEDGQDSAYVELGYPHNEPYFVYNEETGLYDRFQYGGAQIDLENGESLCVKNIILEYQNAALYQTSSYWHYEMTGSGKGKYITNGKAVDITWERDDFFSQVTYRLEDGSELVLNPGKTWVALIQRADIDECLIGANEDSAVCVIPEDEAAAVIADADAWIASYKEGEEQYLSEMAAIRTANVEKHGGNTKVEPNLP